MITPSHQQNSATHEGLEVFQKCDMYDRIVRGNWMRHRELWAAIDQTIADHDHALKVLDVGSGDGAMAFGGLSQQQLERYVALDLSNDALQSMLTKPVPGLDQNRDPRQAIQGDFTQTVREQPQGHFDVVICSFSLHHLSFRSKQNILCDLSRILTQRGQLIWVDIYLKPNENRGDFLKRLKHYILDSWVDLTPSERQEAVEHIWSSDYPETEMQMERIMADAGFLHRRRIWNDGFFCMWASENGQPAP